MQIDEKALLPCPFCGGEPTVSTRQDESLWSHNTVTKTHVSCLHCDVSFESEPGYELEAPEAWNRRSPLAYEAAKPAPASEAVAGWKLVPVKAPQVMLDAFFKTMILRRPLGECWSAALDAAPLVPAPATAPTRCGSCGAIIEPDVMTGTRCACTPAPGPAAETVERGTTISWFTLVDWADALDQAALNSRPGSDKTGLRERARQCRAAAERALAAPASAKVEAEPVGFGIRFESFRGEISNEERERIRASDLYKRGDTVLVWVNEGDLYMFAHPRPSKETDRG
jgi:Lar family restriction alleviation protein